MAANGLGGILAGRVSITRLVPATAVVVAMLACSLTLATSHNAVHVIAAQAVMALLLVAVSTLLTRLLHDEIPSSIRAGVSSGVGTLHWMAFLPFSLAFGFTADHAGVHTAAWPLVATTAAAGSSLLRLAARRRSTNAPTGAENARSAVQPVLLPTDC